MDRLYVNSEKDTLRGQLLGQVTLRDNERLLLAPSMNRAISVMAMGAAKYLPPWLVGCCNAAVVSNIGPLDGIGEQVADTRPGSDSWAQFLPIIASAIVILAVGRFFRYSDVGGSALGTPDACSFRLCISAGAHIITLNLDLKIAV